MFNLLTVDISWAFAILKDELPELGLNPVTADAFCGISRDG